MLKSLANFLKLVISYPVPYRTVHRRFLLLMDAMRDKSCCALILYGIGIEVHGICAQQ